MLLDVVPFLVAVASFVGTVAFAVATQTLVIARVLIVIPVGTFPNDDVKTGVLGTRDRLFVELMTEPFDGGRKFLEYGTAVAEMNRKMRR